MKSRFGVVAHPAFVALPLAMAPAAGQGDTPRTAHEWSALCDERPQNRQLDFWLGTWDVYDAGQKVAESTITRMPGSCAVLESYAQPDGYGGKSINYFDAALGKWRQVWVDEIGTVSEFTGEFNGHTMRLEGRTHTRDGKEILRKMELSAPTANSVRQYSQRSIDGGTTWGVAYDLEYRRRKTAAKPK